MNDASRTGFQFRALISVLTGISFLLLVISGIVLFITPPGRIAHWTGWRFWGMTKDQWGATHIWFGLTFLAAALLHLYLNWRPLLNYFKNRLTKRFAVRTEWLVAVIVCVVVFVGGLLEVPPFSSLIAWDDQIKLSWDVGQERAPIPHAELLSLADLAQEVELDVAVMLANLTEKGILDGTPETVLGELAKRHGKTPNELFLIATAAAQAEAGDRLQHATGTGKGLGRLTIKEFCRQEGLDPKETLRQLREAGIPAETSTTLREIAQEYQIRPHEIVKMLADQGSD